MSVLRVFEGDVTDEGDYLSIVLPILGLYAELYALELKRRAQAVPWQSSPAAAAEAALCQVGSEERRAQTLQLVLNEIRGAKRGEIFSPKLRMSAQRLAQLPLRKRLLSRLPTRVFGGCFDPRRDLFGELIHLVERAIDLDPQILDEAVAQAERERERDSTTREGNPAVSAADREICRYAGGERARRAASAEED